MASSTADDRSRLQPTVEDCPDVDDMRGEHQANIRTKRSQSSELRQDGQDKATDVFSDSGYSSRTAATVSTADSAESSPPARKTPRSSTTVPVEPQQEPVRRPEAKQKTSKPSEKSKPSRTKANIVQKELPRAKDDGRNSQRKSHHAEDHEKDEQYVAERERQRYSRGPARDSDQRQSHVSEPSRRSPSYVRHQSYNNGHTVVQPGVSQQRRASVSSRPRPSSFHSADTVFYGERVPTHNQPHGPPPSSSAWHNARHHAHAQPSAGYYPSDPHNHYGTSPYDTRQQYDRSSPYESYDSARHQPASVDPNYSARGRPTSMFGMPQSYATPQTSLPVTKIPSNFAQPTASPQSEPAGPSARYGPPAPVQPPVQYTPQYPHYAPQQLAQFPYDEGDSSGTDSEFLEEHPFAPHGAQRALADDRAIMPPPQFPASHNRDRDRQQQRRGSIYRASEDRDYPAPPSPARDRREKEYFPTSSRSYNSSSRRQSISSSARTKESSYPSSKGSSRKELDRTPRRLNSHAKHEPRHPRFDVESEDEYEDGYYSYEEDEEDEERTRLARSFGRASLSRHPSERRPRDGPAPKRDDYASKMKQAELHQSDPRGQKMSASDAILRDKASKGSKYQERIAFDAKSTRSSMTKQSKGGVTIMVQGEDDLNIKLDGNMDGQTLSFRKVDGATAIIVGSSQGPEKSYRGSERSYHLGPEPSQRESIKGSNRSKTSKTSDQSRESRRSRRQENEHY